MDSETLKAKRRSHLNRRAKEKGVVFTEGDILDIFERLSRHAQLTTSQLVAYGRLYPTITKTRLGELWHVTSGEGTHWLHRLNEDVVFANHLVTEDFHRLGVEADQLFQAHDHMVIEITLDIELGARAKGIYFRSHLEILKGAPEATRAARRPLQIPSGGDAWSRSSMAVVILASPKTCGQSAKAKLMVISSDVFS